MALNLVTPLGSNFLKDFPANNEVNCDLIDDYAKACLPSQPLPAFTPGLTATTTAPNLGVGGFNSGYYYEVFDQVFAWGQFRFGTSGFSAGSGVYIVTLPFVVAPSLASGSSLSDMPVIGNGQAFDASLAANTTALSVHLRTASQLSFGIRINAGAGFREVRDTGLITWAAGDGVNWSASFKRVP